MIAGAVAPARMDLQNEELVKAQLYSTRRGSFESVPQLITAIEEYLAASNADPKPFVWHTSAQAILNKLARCKAIYETLD